MTAHRIRHLVQIVLLTAIIGGTVVGCSDSSDTKPAAAVSARALAPPKASDNLLFVARAARGTLKVGTGKTGTLTLEGLAAVTWFSDRPERDAGTTKVTDALGTFDWHANGDTLSDDPPNATLVATELGTDVVVVELLTATIDAKQVSFEVRRVTDSWPARGTLTNIDLFIDDASAFPFTVNTTLPGGDTATVTVNADLRSTVTLTSADGTAHGSAVLFPSLQPSAHGAAFGPAFAVGADPFSIEDVQMFPPMLGHDGRIVVQGLGPSGFFTTTIATLPSHR